MAKKIWLFVRILMLTAVMLILVKAQSNNDQTIIITQPASENLPAGTYRAVIEVGGKKVVAQINVTAQSSAPTGNQPGGSTNSDPASSGTTNKNNATTNETNQPASAGTSVLLWILLAGLGTGALIGSAAWWYFKVNLPRKQLEPYHQALELITTQNYETALPQLTQVESKLPDNLRRDARFFVAFSHYKTGGAKDAEYELDKLYRENPEDVEIAYLLAYLRVEAKKYDEAEPVLTALEKQGQLNFKFTKKLLGIVQFHRAMSALNDGYIEGAATLFEQVEALGDFADKIPLDLRNRNIALGTKALFDKNLEEARRQFEALEKAAASEKDEQRQNMLTTAKIGFGLIAWLEDTPESDSTVETLLSEAVKLLDATQSLEMSWVDKVAEKDLLAKFGEADAKAELSDEQKQLERCLRDIQFLRGIAVLRTWQRLDGPEAHTRTNEFYKSALSKFACVRALDDEFSDVFLVVGLLKFYLNKPGPERSSAVDVLEEAQNRGMSEPYSLEIINNRARIEQGNADAVDLYMQVLDNYLHDETVRAEVRIGLLNRLGQYKKIQSWGKTSDLNHSRRIEPTVAEMRNRSEILRVRVDQIIASQSRTQEVKEMEKLSDTIEEKGKELYAQAQAIEENESELLALTGSQLFKDQ